MFVRNALFFLCLSISQTSLTMEMNDSDKGKMTESDEIDVSQITEIRKYNTFPNVEMYQASISKKRWLTAQYYYQGHMVGTMSCELQCMESIGSVKTKTIDPKYFLILQKKYAEQEEVKKANPGSSWRCLLQ